jgi:hypothetical protein
MRARLGMSRESDLIADQEAKAADLRKRADEALRLADMEEAVLRGMRLMAQGYAGLGQILPGASSEVIKAFAANNPPPAPNRRGRQPGAISHEWRDTLGILYRDSPDQFSISHAIAAALASGLHRVGSREVEDRLRNYLDLGYVERAGSGFKVSELVAKKYGFSRRQTQEAPTAVAEGASK